MKSFAQYLNYKLNEQDAPPPAAPPPPAGGAAGGAGSPPPMPPMGGGGAIGGGSAPQTPAKKIKAVSVWSSLKKMLDGDQDQKVEPEEKKTK